MNLLTRARARRDQPADDTLRYSLEQWYTDLATQVQFGGNSYGTVGTWSSTPGERIPADFRGHVTAGYEANGIVFSVILSRLLVFSEARFQWQRMVAGRTSELFGTVDLAMLERPWPNGTTGDLLARAEQDVSLAGNHYVAKVRGGRLRRLRPDWTMIVSESPNDGYENESDDPEATVTGYVYSPGGFARPTGPTTFFPVEDVAHYAPIPDPDAEWRGMSWLTPVIREVRGDTLAQEHKAMFFRNSGTPNMVVKLPASIATKAKFDEFRDLIEAGHRGVANAWKTLYLSSGADATVVGNSFKDMQYREILAAGETRIAAAAGVPPIIAGLSEGLQAATYSNYAQAKRRFADGTIRPLWRSVAAAYERLLPVPAAAGSGVRLWYDDRDVAFLRDDARDEAEILAAQMSTIASGVNAGFTAESVVRAVEAQNIALLEHTGLFSVQLQAAGTDGTPTDPGSDS